MQSLIRSDFGQTGSEDMTAVTLDAFAAWIAEKWSDGFEHHYSISGSHHRAWNRWRLQSSSSDEWWCHSLRQACEHYSWVENGLNFDLLSSALQTSLEAGDSAAVKKNCAKIFEWGGVARTSGDRSRMWIDLHCKNGDISSAIKRAVSLLKPNSDESLDEFDGKRLLMNSAMTKVYAAADSEKAIVMYDGRVGAALGLLVRTMLEQRGIHSLPGCLAFRWGPSAAPRAAEERTRDPSTEKYRFQQLPHSSTVAQADKIRAELARSTNRICWAVCNRLAARGVNVAPPEIERALFMIGYDVRGHGKKHPQK